MTEQLNAVVRREDIPGWPQMMLFDLDGTLIDSAPDIRAATNRLIAADGHAPLSLDEVRRMIGNGIRKLVERAFAARGVDLNETALDRAHARMMAIYGDHLTAETTLMPMAAEMLAAYHRAGVEIAVVTNKPEGFSRAILDALALSQYVGHVVGGDSCATRKPDPGMLLYAAGLGGVGVGRCLMVGDSPADINAAKAAGMVSIAVRGGYTNVPVDELGADAVIDSLGDLPATIEAFEQRA